MGEDFKERVKLAISNFEHRQALKSQRITGRKNKKPEQDVARHCLAWMRSVGFAVDIYESKANFNPKVGLWLQQSMRTGTTDCIGTDPDGFAAFIEFKAPGKLKSLRDSQRAFIYRKIDAGAFACVVDSAERLADIYRYFKLIKSKGKCPKNYLRAEVPDPPESKQTQVLFPE